MILQHAGLCRDNVDDIAGERRWGSRLVKSMFNIAEELINVLARNTEASLLCVIKLSGKGH
jgi:hypothetical protein